MAELFLWILFSIGVAILADVRGRSWFAFLCLSLVLSPVIGLIVLLVTKPDRAAVEQRAIDRGEMRKCPFCAELVKTEALICRYCGRDLPKIPTLVERATTER